MEGKGEEALGELERALERTDRLAGSALAGPGLAEIHSAIGYIHFECRRFEKAAESYHKLLEIEPRYPSGRRNLALCLEALGR